MSVGEQEFFQVLYLSSEFYSFVGVGDEHSVRAHFNDLQSALDVGSFLDGFAGGGEGLVLHELESPAVVNERVSCDSCFFVVGL